jgi:hypothetical protein
MRRNSGGLVIKTQKWSKRLPKINIYIYACISVASAVRANKEREKP